MKKSKKRSEYQWQGRPVEVVFGIVKVTEDKEKPLMWYNYECNTQGHHPHAYIPAVLVKTANSQFAIANEHGQAVRKLREGGWPNRGHSSLFGEFRETDEYKVTKYNFEAAMKREQKAAAWFCEKYPEEYEKMEALKEMIVQQKTLNRNGN